MPKSRIILSLALGGVVLSTMASSGYAQQTEAARLKLPIVQESVDSPIGLTVQESGQPSFPEPVKAPEGAPNVLLIITDDVGFGATSAFGGPIPTPTMEALAAQGGRYNSFHTTALCAPTRASLLTGRNPHSVGTGVIGEMATGYPGYTTIIPRSAATVGKVLRENGYSTAWIGKNHSTPDWEVTPVGPFDRWPVGLGFEYFYGFIGGATNAFAPTLYQNTTAVEPENTDAYYLETDLADRAIDWLRTQHETAPGKPFFMHYATLAAHTPNQAPADWVARFDGQFQMGWDEMRKQTFERQKRQGIVPADAELTPRPSGIPAWNSLSDDEKRLAQRMMASNAAQLAYTDHELGRVVDELKRLGVYENTLIIFVSGDNGASGEGGIGGTTNDIGALNGRQPTTEQMVARIDEIGISPYIQNNYQTGWAWSMDTPFQWTKAIASHFGGTRNGLVISWPGHIKKPQQIREQFHHVIDIVPTIYDAVGIPAPEIVDGIEQMPIHGVSMAYTFADPDAADQRTEQYFEMFGNRAFYKDGWIASTTPLRAPGNMVGVNPNPNDYPWELYDVSSDFSQARNLASRYPEKLADLRKGFDEAAQRYNVYPIDASGAERIISEERPYPLKNKTEFFYGPSTQRYHNSAWPDFKNKSWAFEVSLTVPEEAPNGTIVAEGGRLGGWGLSIRNGRPTFVYRVGPEASDQFTVAAVDPLAPGKHTINVSFDYDGGGFGKGGLLKIISDGKLLAQGRMERTVPFIFQEGASIGRDYGTTLEEGYALPDSYNGSIDGVSINLKPGN